MVCEEAGKNGKVCGGGIAFDSAQLIQGNRAGGKTDTPVEEVNRLGEFECSGGILVAVVPCSPLEDAPGVRNFCGHDVTGDVEAGGFAIRAAVLLTPEEDVSRRKPVRAREKFPVWRVKRERDPGLCAAGHECCASHRVVAEAHDAIEVVKRNPEPDLPIVPDLHRLAIFSEISTLQRDEKRVEVGFQWT